jgi:choice-of-anchor C domain-containing protein
MRGLLTSFGAAAALFAVTSSQASANLISDGDFNNSNPSFQTIGAPSSFGPWTVTNGSVDLIGGYWQSPSGPNFPSGTNGSVDLDGNSPGAISQTLSLAAGSYELSFYLSGNPDGPPPTKQVGVSVGNQNDVVFAYTIGGNTHSNMNYELETLFFTVSGPTALTFASLDTYVVPGYGPTPYGPVIGGVDVSATPLPSTWSMLVIGFAGLGFFACRGNRKGSAAIAAA